MTALDNAHLANPPVLAGAPLEDARAVGVLVHGRDQGPEVMLDVAGRLHLPEVAYVLPVASERSWYPGRFFDPITDNEPHVSWSLEAFEAAIATACTRGTTIERIVLGGFSQGACLIAELVARRPRPFAGVAVLTGTLMGPAGTEIRPAHANGLAMFIASSRYDGWIPLERAEATARAFELAGAQVAFEVHDDREHHVSDRAVAGVRALFDRLPIA
jgi:predicted esterase